jgi:spore coat protein A, manganese oxidase
MGLTRREAIKMGVAIGGLSPLGWTGAAIAQEVPRQCSDPNKALPFSPKIQRFVLPLTMPKVLSKTKSDGDTDYYNIRIQKGFKQYEVPLEGDNNPIQLKIPYWGYDGCFPGPTIVQDRHRYSYVRFVNELEQIKPNPTERDEQGCFVRGPEKPRGQYNDMVIHLHGMNSVPYYDGYALDIIPPGYYKDYLYPNDEPGTFWYHDHTIDRTAENVQRGLAGMYWVVDRDRDQDLKLPTEEYDLPLILQDREFEPDPTGSKTSFIDRCFNDRGHNSFYGDVICVNGVPFPYLDVEPRQYRFRILNASPSRHFRLALSLPNRPNTVGGTITVIGNDQDLLPAPIPIDTGCQALSVGMAERYDVIIDFSDFDDQDQIFLRNIGSTGMRDSSDRVTTIMQFRVKGKNPVKTQLPPVLNPEFHVLEEREAKPQRRRFRFEQGGPKWVINGKSWDAYRSDADPVLGETEIWEFVNPGSGWIHPVHPHLIKFQILSRNGKKPPCYQRGWKDVVMVHEFETVRVIMKFKPHKGRYMMHCHNLVHEDHMMMTQFDVGGLGAPQESPGARLAKPVPLDGKLPEMQRTETILETEPDRGPNLKPCETKSACLG